MSWFQTFGKGQEMEVVSQSIKTTVDIPCQECGCAYGWHEQSLEAIDRVRELADMLNKPNSILPQSVTRFAVAESIYKALDGEQE
jgi:hypothetical protein